MAETIVQGRPHQEPFIFDLKAQPLVTFTPGYTLYIPHLAQNARPPLNLNLFVIAFRPQNIMSYTPPSASYVQSMTQQTMDDIEAGSQWHGYANPAQQPSIQYVLADGNFTDVNSLPMTRTANGYLDLAAIYNRFGICNKVKSGAVDEVWLWVDGGTTITPPIHSAYAPSEFTINGPVYIRSIT